MSDCIEDLIQFKKNYRPYTNYSMSWLTNDFDGPKEFGSYISTTIYKGADLLCKSFIEIQLGSLHETDDLSDMLHDNGYGLIDYIEFKIGDK